MVAEPGAAFAHAADAVQRLPARPDNDTLLKLYALYKQATQGDAHGPKPGFFDFVETAKFEAWSALQGMAPDEAERKYVELVERLQAA